MRLFLFRGPGKSGLSALWAMHDSCDLGMRSEKLRRNEQVSCIAVFQIIKDERIMEFAVAYADYSVGIMSASSQS